MSSLLDLHLMGHVPSVLVLAERKLMEAVTYQQEHKGDWITGVWEEYAFSVLRGTSTLSGMDKGGKAGVRNKKLAFLRKMAVKACRKAGGHVRRANSLAKNGTTKRGKLSLVWTRIPARAIPGMSSVGPCWIY